MDIEPATAAAPIQTAAPTIVSVALAFAQSRFGQNFAILATVAVSIYGAYSYILVPEANRYETRMQEQGKAFTAIEAISRFQADSARSNEQVAEANAAAAASLRLTAEIMSKTIDRAERMIESSSRSKP